ncbi:uncharacterized protein [Salmo salar]|uniref:exodeoxyribonuclease III n=1 Tax=Salmo salar TaxID=8030 RepID=A0A1S3QDT2_SALSA|nr:uncharacterized protein LOC106591310 [Salmo salar]|eukprot:XP_014037997.1 PREDICTED: uncharacterized protein LOC106591310 [Salmo salar]
MQSSLGMGAVSGDTIVFFDLETTGLDTSMCDIIQLSAISGERTFNVYAVPRCNMTHKASSITGFTVRDPQTLLLNGRQVDTIPLREALTSFISFLRSFHKPLLAAHNARRFDCPVLARALVEFDLKAEFQLAVSGCLDTLPLAREILKGRGLQSFRQENLVRIVVGISYEAHNALEDVRALQRLYGALRPTLEQVLRQSFTLDTMAEPAPKQPPAAKA